MDRQETYYSSERNLVASEILMHNVKNITKKNKKISILNERITENIVRNIFNRNNDGSIHIYEQKTDIPKIQKLLKSASKKGLGVGYPEFILVFKNYPDFLIIVECKADRLKHESKNRDKYSEYAVDGVLLYASCLSKEFDVLAIAVSGQNQRELEVNHFLQLRGENIVYEKFGDKILDFQNYIDEYIKSPEKFNQDYHQLLDYSRELNEELHAKKIKESQRSLLISGILIALKNKAFRSSYKDHNTPKELAESIVITILNQLRGEILEENMSNLEIAYSFIKTHPALSKEEGVLVRLIEDIDHNINIFMRTHEFIDVLGQFYIEFLRYANDDSQLGIVLTPPHITELFVDLANVNRDSIVLDNCCGTGGFLISSLKKMFADAKGDSDKIKSIKKKQIIGIEYQDHIFALACSNMSIHEDGKSNLMHGDSYDENVIKKVQEKKPNIGFLNPPYKTKKSPKEELEFVINNLEMLQKNSICIAILPISCALAQEGKPLKLKETLLRYHTLEAVMSMPNELFHNSNVGVVTCIMVFTAHIPHPKGKKTWFAYWKDDGFVKVKNRGRIDEKILWSLIKSKWVNSFRNKTVIHGFSLMQEVKAEDEWCFEAYMETDYSDITNEDFIDEMKRYVTFKLLNNY